MADQVCTSGEVNPDYNSGALENFNCNMSDGLFEIGFSGTANLPYAIWASINCIDWSQAGTAAQPAPGISQFDDLDTTSHNARFYEVRLL